MQWLTGRVAPGTCTLVFRNNYLAPKLPKADTGKISGTHWKNWGHGTATGTGWLQLGVRGAKNKRATMKAYDKRVLPKTPDCLTATSYYAKIAVTDDQRPWTFKGAPLRQC